MKKFYALSLLLVAGLSYGQTNLVQNGGFETWTAGAPDNFAVTVPAAGGSATQETAAANVHGGASSIKVTAPAGTGNVQVAVTDIPVTPGNTYTFSYWVKDESDNARGRHWASWRAGSGQLNDNLDVLQPGGYQDNTSGWLQVTHTLTAPATATAFRIAIRVYQQASGANSGEIFYDDLMFYDTATGSIKDNNIAGLTMFPNPLTGNVLNITSNSDADKTVAIFDVLGKQVVNTKVSNGTVNVSALTSGVYIVKVTEEGKTATKKLVVK